MEKKMLAVMFMVLGAVSIVAFILSLLFYINYRGVYGGIFMSEIDFILRSEIAMMVLFPLLAFFADQNDHAN